MGYGGNLVWTRVISSINKEFNKKILLCDKPLLSDLLRGNLYNCESDYENDEVFRNNPKVKFIKCQNKTIPLRFVDYLFKIIIYPRVLLIIYEWIIFKSSLLVHRNRDFLPVYLDMFIHSYARRELSDRFIWKDGGDIASVITQNFGVEHSVKNCEFFFSKNESEVLQKKIIDNYKLKKYIVIESGSNTDWFGDLRAWPEESWKTLLGELSPKLIDEDIEIVQVGLKTTNALNGVKDLRGKTTFREVAYLMSKSMLFIGTEGGLMHLANSVKVDSIILWGGVTTPEFAGYKDTQTVICNYVDCISCGLKGNCPNNIKCMKSISPSHVKEVVFKKLSLES